MLSAEIQKHSQDFFDRLAQGEKLLTVRELAELLAISDKTICDRFPRHPLTPPHGRSGVREPRFFGVKNLIRLRNGLRARLTQNDHGVTNGAPLNPRHLRTEFNIVNKRFKIFPADVLLWFLVSLQFTGFFLGSSCFGFFLSFSPMTRNCATFIQRCRARQLVEPTRNKSSEFEATDSREEVYIGPGETGVHERLLRGAQARVPLQGVKNRPAMPLPKFIGDFLVRAIFAEPFYKLLVGKLAEIHRLCGCSLGVHGGSWVPLDFF
jgi:hypothetical protein